MAKANNFDRWSKTFVRELQRANGSKVAIEMTATVQPVKEPPFDKWAEEFAKEFVEDVFVPEMFQPAFEQGKGLSGAHGAVSDLQDAIPRIAKGWTAYEKTEDASDFTDVVSHNGTSYRRGIETFNWNARLKRPIEQRENEKMAELSAEYNAARSQKARSEILSRITALQERIEKREKRALERRKERGLNDKNNREVLQKDDVNSDGGSSIKGQWAAGFDKMFKLLSQVVRVERTRTGVTVSMGNMPALMNMRLDAYSVTSGAGSKVSSAYNSFFYAAEFGTGIAENVGGPQWVRHRQRGPGGAEIDKPRLPGHLQGSWFFDTPGVGGALMQGQKGLHTLFEPNTREPRSEYQQWVSKNIGRYLTDFLHRKSAGRIR